MILIWGQATWAQDLAEPPWSAEWRKAPADGYRPSGAIYKTSWNDILKRGTSEYIWGGCSKQEGGGRSYGRTTGGQTRPSKTIQSLDWSGLDPPGRMKMREDACSRTAEVWVSVGSNDATTLEVTIWVSLWLHRESWEEWVQSELHRTDVYPWWRLGLPPTSHVTRGTDPFLSGIPS